MSIMQEQPSRYTRYARSLCPSWCTEDHIEPTDTRSLGCVHHKGPVDVVTTTDIYGAPEPVDVRLGRWDSLDDNNPDGRTSVVLWTDMPEYLSAADARKVAQLLIRAAEAADRG